MRIYKSLESGEFFTFIKERIVNENGVSLNEFIKVNENGEPILAVNLLLSPEPMPQTYIFSRPFEDKFTVLN